MGKQALKQGVAAMTLELSKLERHKALRTGAQIIQSVVAPPKKPVRRMNKRVKGKQDIFV